MYKFKIFGLLIIYSIIFLTVSCKNENSVSPVETKKVNTTIAIFSDPHLYDPALGTKGKAFLQYLAKDRKLIAESDAILRSLINTLKTSEAEIILVPGDLTKDGTKASHQKFASYLKELENAGKKVFIVPGNHDISNPESFSYSGSAKTKVENVDSKLFKSIYNNFGYSEAISKDPNSLSYVAEPVPGLLLIGMDPCRYSENAGRPHPVTGGKFSDKTLEWIKKEIKNGTKKNKLVIGMMHHGLTEHFKGQKQYFSEYVVDDHINCATKFSDAGMKMVFTGHFHAHDISKFTTGENFIFDIETGSLVTAPCPYRFVKISESTTAQITSGKVESINFDLKGKNFQTYASDYLKEGLNGLIVFMLKNQYGLDLQTASQLAPYINQAMRAHYNGDEKIPAAIQQFITKLQSESDPKKKMIATLLESLFKDPDPEDLTLTINLVNGKTN